MTPIRSAAALAGALLVGALATPASAQMLSPTPYVKSADSPFTGTLFSIFVRETFEDNAFNTVGAVASGTWFPSGPGDLVDSVDEDDGSIDGLGRGGHSFYSNGVERTLTITFDAAALGGRLPTHAGIVWTDVGLVDPGFNPGVTDVTFTAQDANGSTLGTTVALGLGDGSAAGGTAEDRFFGVVHAGGIKSITIAVSNSKDWEVDHLLYGIQAVPEPETWAMLGIGALLLGTRLARRRG